MAVMICNIKRSYSKCELLYQTASLVSILVPPNTPLLMAQLTFHSFIGTATIQCWDQQNPGVRSGVSRQIHTQSGLVHGEADLKEAQFVAPSPMTLQHASCHPDVRGSSRKVKALLVMRMVAIR